MRIGRGIKRLFTKLAPIGMAFVMAGCGAGDATQNVSSETAETAELEESVQRQGTVQEQDAVKVQDPQEWEWEAEDEQTLRRVFAQEFGGRAGVCVPMAAISDEARMELVKGQFNSVTMENEMKPESFLGYRPNIGEDGFPILDFTVPDMMMKEIKAYNDTVGVDGRKIMVRGHVLVWHSQTPEWFFHEEYNENNPYVDKQTMLARMENYIKNVMEHYEGADSEFKGMIYAWDVVNEAVNDSDGGLRTQSSWFNVFHNSDFIEWAFVYANQYAPAHIKLFYNDYNDTNARKADGICKLIEKIKANPEARIDGMGMQGHYDMSFSASEFEESARKYAALVDEIQITELDLKSSMDFDGSSIEEEYQKQAYVYQSLFDAVVSLKKDGVPITAIVFWGTDDAHSWLQGANFVGGSADGTRMQCPLLFDAQYQPKPAFWAFVDASRLGPIIHSVLVSQMDDYEAAEAIAFGDEETKAAFVPIWNDKGLGVKILVEDAKADEGDHVTLYAQLPEGEAGSRNVITETIDRSAGKETDKGYEAEFFVETEVLEAFSELKFDVRVHDADKLLSWNDTENNQDNSSEAFGKLILKPFAKITKGTANVDGVEEGAWEKAQELVLSVVNVEGGKSEASGTAKALWDENALYVLMKVTDPNLDVSAEEPYIQDSVEVFIDEKNDKAREYKLDDKQYRVNCENAHSFNGAVCKEEYITSQVKRMDDGYVVEMAIAWTDKQPKEGDFIGFEVQINDCKNGARLGMINWYDTTNTCWSTPASFGTARLTGQ
ncbi:MAG: endo-1,4-beta-xylanase [Lachnospiraceae bacterium]|nr:endo-1,4-beta-xylanase [Lachnospiraceae bacterium]